MDNSTQQRLLDFLTASFDTDGTMRYLAVSASEFETTDKPNVLYKVRVAVTFQEGDSIIPYFDGTDMYVEIGLDTIQFAREHEWADGPPIMEGSPNELALPWVSKLSPPFFVSAEAQESTSEGMIDTRKANPDVNPDKHF